MLKRKNPNFTRNPDKLKGQRIRTALIKSSRGLGISIVASDDTVEEFLQIKSVVPNGPAWLDGKLQTGDVLVYVNDTCVLGFTHHEIANVSKSIGSGETVSLEVCRGYPLPFDPNDPNTEGLGFTIADSAHGQKVKKILDRQRWKNLMEGDILVNINEINVRNMCHSEVVQVLKDCPRKKTLIRVQRTTTKSTKEKQD